MAEPDRRSSALREVVLRWQRGQRSCPGALQGDQLSSGCQTGHHHTGRSRSDAHQLIVSRSVANEF